MSDKRVRVQITGRVQGVFFRDSTRQEAQRLGVTGWVRNRADGSVEGVFEGPQESVDQLVAWCEAGPSHADVDEVAVEPEDPTGEFDGSFRVRR